jgi:hypothetical protein
MTQPAVLVPEYPRLFGQRMNRAGQVVDDYVAGSALSVLHYGPPLPIFEYSNKDVTMGSNLPAKLRQYADVDGSTFQYTSDVPSKKPIRELNRLLKRDLDELDNNSPVYDRPLVFLVASSAPHAMIYIISSGKVFTVGFGYLGSPGRTKLPRTLEAAGQPGLAHTFEILNGALYSADYLMPNDNQGAKLVWVGFLTDDIIDNIKQDLVQVNSIVYTGTIDARGVYNVSYNCMLGFGQGYCEAAGFINKDTTTNCILWAQSKLNIKVECGWAGNPKECRPILPAEFDDLRNNMNNGPRLIDIVTDIQARLAVGNICTQISRRLGICGGRSSKRRKNIKRKNKNKKTHKKTSKKTKKNRRRN